MKKSKKYIVWGASLLVIVCIVSLISFAIKFEVFPEDFEFNLSSIYGSLGLNILAQNTNFTSNSSRITSFSLNDSTGSINQYSADGPPYEPCTYDDEDSDFWRSVDNPLNDQAIVDEIMSKINSITNRRNRAAVLDAFNRIIALSDDIIKDKLCGCVHPDDIENQFMNNIAQLDTIVEAANDNRHFFFMNGIPGIRPGFTEQVLDPISEDEQRYANNPPGCERSDRQY